MTGLDPVLVDLEPDVVVVVGDVNSTMAASLVAAKSPARLAHVEAGLRSRDWTMPEEVNRLVTDSVCDDLLARSADAVDNLLAEGHPPERIHLVGNVMIDTLFANLDRARGRGVLGRLGLEPGRYGLVTLHRPANVDELGMLKSLLGALGEIAAVCPLLLPAHPRVAPQLAALQVPDGLDVTEPLGYLDFVAVEASARLVLTDSGGVQEETTALGVPCLTMRDTTERPVTITDGTNLLVGRDPRRIVTEALRVLDEGAPPRRPALWDGRAGERIADVLLDTTRSRRRGRSRRWRCHPKTRPLDSPGSPAIPGRPLCSPRGERERWPSGTGRAIPRPPHPTRRRRRSSGLLPAAGWSATAGLDPPANSGSRRPRHRRAAWLPDRSGVWTGKGPR